MDVTTSTALVGAHFQADGFAPGYAATELRARVARVRVFEGQNIEYVSYDVDRSRRVPARVAVIRNAPTRAGMSVSRHSGHGRPPEKVREVWSVGHQTSRFHVFTKGVHRRYPRGRHQSEEMSVFTFRNFYSVCTDICATKSYVYTLREAQISIGYKPPAPEVFVPAFATWLAAPRRPAPPVTLAQRPTLN
jgi:hypothetical protein